MIENEHLCRLLTSVFGLRNRIAVAAEGQRRTIFWDIRDFRAFRVSMISRALSTRAL